MTVSITNGVTFAADQALTLTESGTAATADYTLDPATLTLAAGEAAVSATLTATDDEAEEAAETVTVTASHGGAAVGSATLIIAASDTALSDDATLSALSLSGVDIGTFDSATTAYAADVAEALASTTATATPSDAEASVTITDGDGSTTDAARTVALDYGANAITATVTAADGQTTKTYAMTVTRAYTPPTASIAARTTPVTEGADASFTVHLDKPALQALTLAVTVSETGAALSGTSTSVVVGAGERSATLTLSTANDSVVEAGSTVTATLGSGDGYTVGTRDSAEVLVEDDDAATFAVSAGSATIQEGDATTVAVAVANGVTFAADQTITLTVSGTAATADYTLDPAPLTLAAGGSSVSSTLAAVDDEAEEPDETITVSAAHSGSTVGTATVTVAANDAPLSDDATLSALTLSGIGIGTFDPATTEYSATVGVDRTTVAATPSDAAASLAIEDANGSTAGTTRTTSLAAGSSTDIRATVTAADGRTTKTYTVAVTRAAPPLTASFHHVPASHDGSSEFTFELRFSEDLDLSYRTLRDDRAFAVTGGSVLRAQRVVQGSNQRWTIAIQPATQTDAVVTLRGGRACGETGAICASEDRQLANSPSATVAAPGSETPEVSIAADAGTVTEGSPASFTLTRTGDATAGLTVAVTVSESGAAVSDDAPATATFATGGSTAALAVETSNDAVVEATSTVTAAIAAGTGYAASADAGSAEVVVEDDDAATFAVGLSPATVAEGASATLTVSIANGVTFAAAQTIALAASGTASASDYALSADGDVLTAPFALTLAAGSAATTAALTATDDATTEAAETVVLPASHDDAAIGTATATIPANDAPLSDDATLSALSLSGVDIGTFDSATTAYAADVAEALASTTATATPSDAEASVTITDGDGSTTDAARTVALDYGANAITATVTAADGQTTKTYAVTVTRAYTPPTASIAARTTPVTEGADASFTVHLDKPALQALTLTVAVTVTGAALSGTSTSVVVGAGERSATLTLSTANDSVVEADSTVTATLGSGDGYTVGTRDSAEVLVEDDDAATFAVSAGSATIQEGDATTVAVAVANGVTFAADQTITLTVSGTAATADYTLDPAPLTLAAGGSSVSSTLAAVDDEAEEPDETITVSAAHSGSTVGTATVTVAANDAPLSDDATLSALTLSGVDIGTFDSGTMAYAADVENAVDRSTVTAMSNDAAAAVVISDAQGSTAGTTRTTQLAEGANEVGVVVTAEDGVAKRSYAVTVTRAAGESAAWGERLADKDIDLAAADRPRGLWADGETLWTGDWDNGEVLAYSLEDGTRLPAKDFALGAYLASALTSDGETLWAADYDGGVYAYRLSDGERLPDSDLDGAAMDEAGNGSPAGLWTDGDTMWVADYGDGFVYAYGLDDGVRREPKEFSLRTRGDDVAYIRPFGLFSDRETVLATDWLRGTVRGYALSDGARRSDRDVDAAGSANGYAAGLWSDGETLWVVDDADQKAYAYVAPGLRKPPEESDSPLSDLASRATVVPAGPAAGAPVWIPDTALRGRIAAALGKSESDIIGVRELAALVVLDVRGAGVAELTGLEYAVNLEGLDLGHNAVEDLRPLAGLASLRRLNLDGALGDPWQLAALSGLKELSLRGNGLADLSSLSSITGLAILDVAENRIEDLTPVGALAGLRVLDVSKNATPDLSPLAGLDNLRELHVGGNRAADLSPLSGWDGLRVISAEEQHQRD